MTQLPNIITLFRIAGSLGLLLCDVTGGYLTFAYGKPDLCLRQRWGLLTAKVGFAYGKGGG